MDIHYSVSRKYVDFVNESGKVVRHESFAWADGVEKHVISLRKYSFAMVHQFVNDDEES